MHVLRPFFVFAAAIALILIARAVFVPADFAVHERGYMYGWYRGGNVEEWKSVKVKFQGKDYCRDCHGEEEKAVSSSPHKMIQCENCHGPAADHPTNPPKLLINRERGLCLRCHTGLPYPTSARAEIKGIDPDQHNPGLDCAGCHNPHEATKPR